MAENNKKTGNRKKVNLRKALSMNEADASLKKLLWAVVLSLPLLGIFPYSSIVVAAMVIYAFLIIKENQAYSIDCFEKQIDELNRKLDLIIEQTGYKEEPADEDVPTEQTDEDTPNEQTE